MAKRHLESALRIGRSVFTELEVKYEQEQGRPVDHVTVFRKQPIHPHLKADDHDDGSTDNHPYGIYCCTFAGTNDTLAVGCGSSALRVLSTITWEEIWKRVPSNKSKLPVMAAHFLPGDETRLAFASADGNVAVCQTSDCRENIRPKKDPSVSDVLWCADEPRTETYALDSNSTGTRLVSAGKDAQVRLYDVETGTLVQVMDNAGAAEGGTPAKAHGRAIFSVRYVEGDEQFVTAGWDPYALLWDSRTSQGIASRIQGPVHVCGDALDVRHCQLLTGSWRMDNALQLWDLRNLSLVKSFQSEKLAWLYSARFAAADTIVAGGSCDGGTAEVLRISGEVVGSLSCDGRPVQCLAVGKRGRVICAAGQSDILTLASLSS